ncbi:MAG: 4Fe-4S binding protein [Deltaproteobacteria bacterium]|nr:4Fe-4S binding protein [Deltaproteobacteria bacterium]MBW1983644.1 4Fe-4S binding protein [Deltaproteobacteria bacterium]
MGKYYITTVIENCSGCLRCQLGCSEANTRKFKPIAAHIHVEMNDGDCGISFTDDCIACGICADNCFYGALTKTVKEKSS